MRGRGLFFWLFVAAVGASVLMAASLFLLVRSFRMGAPDVSSGSVLRVDLDRPYPEEAFYELGGPFFPTSELTFRELLLSIERAKTDDRIESLFLYVRPARLGWANAVGLRRELLEFKETGKPVVAYIEYASTMDYYLAAAADKVYIHPRALLDLRGLRAEVLFLKNALDKVGIEAQFVRAGEYKDAPDVFLREDLSDTSRESLGALLATVHEEIVAGVREGRGLTNEAAREAIGRGPFTASQARNVGLVDEVLSIDEARRAGGRGGAGEKEDEGEADPGPEPAVGYAAHDVEPGELVAVSDYRRARRDGRRGLLGVDGRIALVYGVGTIVSGGSTDDAVFGRVMGSDTMVEALRSVREDESIDAVVFRIDSPGGSSVASDVIWREAMLTGQEKPIVVSMGNVAASGGYWIATASDVVVAEPTTVTGSIGVFAGKFILRGLYEKIGVDKDGVSTASNADFFSDTRPFSERETDWLRRAVLEDYEEFLMKVAEARGKTRDEVHEVAQGRVWSGRDALSVGLVDELGGLERAVTIAREKAGLDESDTVELVIYPEKRNLLEAILAGFLTAASAGGPSVEPHLLFGRWLEDSETLRSLRSARSLALMPFDVRIR